MMVRCCEGTISEKMVLFAAGAAQLIKQPYMKKAAPYNCSIPGPDDAGSN